MALARRLMWPRVGDDVTIFENGRLLVEGHVTYSGDDVVRILDSEAETSVIDTRELLFGIENRTIVVKKKARTS